jgi:hypothetical protein
MQKLVEAHMIQPAMAVCDRVWNPAARFIIARGNMLYHRVAPQGFNLPIDKW